MSPNSPQLCVFQDPPPVVSLNKGIPVVTSMHVGEHFEKQHKNVLRDIRRIEEETPDKEWLRLNFEQCFKINELANGKQEPYYLLTRNGFMVLAMGFTGSRAMHMKVAFIKAFSAMEAELLSLRGGNGQTLDACGLTLAAKRLPVVQKVQLMNNATQIAKAEGRIHEVKMVYADLCNTVAEGSMPWPELEAANQEESVRLFAEQRCTVSDNQQRRILLTVVYGEYATWCALAEPSYAPVSQHRFMHMLPRFVKNCRVNRPRVGEGRPYFFRGLCLSRGSA